AGHADEVLAQPQCSRIERIQLAIATTTVYVLVSHWHTLIPMLKRDSVVESQSTTGLACSEVNLVVQRIANRRAHTDGVEALTAHAGLRRVQFNPLSRPVIRLVAVKVTD